MARGDQVAKPRKPKSVRRVYGTNHRKWKELSQRFKAYSKSRKLPCWLHEYGLCVFHGAPIDYSAAPMAPMGFETDHIKPRVTHPHLMMMWENLAASHSKCNRTRGATPVALETDSNTSNGVSAKPVWVRPTW
jgi:5-methylcytosine-specific restriction endonuclease McrA